MNNNNTSKNKALTRIRIAKGHLEKVEKMLEDGAYCPDIIHQNRAVQASLKKIDEVILDGHLHSCVLKEMYGNSDKVNRRSKKMVEEIVELFRKN